MPSVIRSEKDGIDEVIEKIKAIDGMLARRDNSPNVLATRTNLRLADEHLSKAREFAWRLAGQS